MEKAWFMAPMCKELWPQWNLPSQFIVFPSGNRLGKR